MGWIKLWRKTLLNPVLNEKPYSNLAAWVDLLLHASHKEATHSIRNIPVVLRAGQLLTSLNQLAARWGTEKWSRKKVAGFLAILESEKMITLKKNNVGTVITVTKWNEYQDNYKRVPVQKAVQKAVQNYGLNRRTDRRRFRRFG